MQEMTPQQLSKYLETTTNNPVLLDVREAWEYEICNIMGSQLIPMQTIPSQLNILDPEQEIVVICHHGVRSRMVGNFLEQEEFKNIINLSGGVNAWAQNIDTNMATY